MGDRLLQNFLSVAEVLLALDLYFPVDAIAFGFIRAANFFPQFSGIECGLVEFNLNELSTMGFFVDAVKVEDVWSR